MLQPLIITGSFLSLMAALIWLQPNSNAQPLFAPAIALGGATQDNDAEIVDIAALLARDLAGPVVIEGFGVSAPARDADAIFAQDVEVTRLMAFAGVRPVPRPENGPVVREPVIETPPALEIVPAVDELPRDPATTVDEAPVLIATAPLPTPPLAAELDTTPTLSNAGPLFAEIAAARSNLLTVTGIDDEGRLRPTLQSLAQNTQLSPSEEPEVRQIAEVTTPVETSVPKQAAPVATRLENSPSTLPIIGVEQATPVLTTQSVQSAEAPQIPTLVFGSAEENSALREQLSNAPTRAVHTVRLGDSLLTLALRYYGDAAKAEVLFEANRRRLPDDGVPRLGQILRIPDIENL